MDKPKKGWSRDYFHYCQRIVKRFCVQLWEDYWSYGCQKSAAALTYMTLFALVPLVTVFYAMFSIVPAFNNVGQELQSFIFSHFIPESGAELQSYLSKFTEQARSLTGFGLAMLVITAYLMLTNIEKTFNSIWGVTRSRKGLSSFLLYWAVLSLGPLLVGIGLAMNTYVLSLKLIFNEFDVTDIGALFLRGVPVFLLASAITLLFVAVPNCRVPIRYAAAGGLVTALCFELIKDVFTLAVTHSSFHTLYGAFAVVPLFLLWVNLTWMIILSGAIFVRTLADQRYLVEEGREMDMVATLKCLSLFQARQNSGRAVSDRDCYRLGLDVVHWQHLRNRLERHQWIAATSGGQYVLIRNLDKVDLWDLAGVLDVKFHDLSKSVANPPNTQWYARYAECRQALYKQTKEILGVSIAQILSTDGKSKRTKTESESSEQELEQMKPMAQKHLA